MFDSFIKAPSTWLKKKDSIPEINEPHEESDEDIPEESQELSSPEDERPFSSVYNQQSERQAEVQSQAVKVVYF